MGEDAIADGRAAVAMGREVEALGQHSTAFGYQTLANNDEAFAAGRLVEANGENSVAIGRESEANGDNSVAIGFNVYANNEHSFAIGKNLTNNESNSIRIGFNKSHHDAPAFCAKPGRIGILKTNPYYHVDVHGKIRANHFIQYSDSRFKNNIKTLKSSLEKLSQTRGVNYSFKQDNKAFNFDDRKQIGFIAQEFKTVFPELVYTDDEGYMSIDYVSLIPVLTDAITELAEDKEEQEEIMDELLEDKVNLSSKLEQVEDEVTILQEQLETVKDIVRRVCEGDCSAVDALGDIEDRSDDTPDADDNTHDSETVHQSALYQNIPNPTPEHEKLTIPYYIYEGAQNAQLIINDLTGRIVVNHDIQARGAGSFELNKTNLDAGTYSYTLYVDNIIIGARKMIVILD